MNVGFRQVDINVPKDYRLRSVSLHVNCSFGTEVGILPPIDDAVGLFFVGELHENQTIGFDGYMDKEDSGKMFV